jgi:hypothetical protein
MLKVSVNEIPGNAKGFDELTAAITNTPEGAAAKMVLALTLYSVNQGDGEIALAKVVHPGQLSPAGSESKLSKRSIDLIKNQIGGKPHQMHSYIIGTSPDQGYQLPAPPYSFDFTTNPHSGRAEEGRIKLFIKSSGADSPRPITVQTDSSGTWKATEWSSLLSGIRAGQK